MSSPQATSRPRIPRRGAVPVEGTPRPVLLSPAPAPVPAPRRTSVLSVSSHVVPFDTAADTPPYAPARFPAGAAARVPAEETASAVDLAAQQRPPRFRGEAPEQPSASGAAPAWQVRAPGTTGAGGSASPPATSRPEGRRRTAALVAVPVVLALGLATVVVLSRDGATGDGSLAPSVISAGGAGGETLGSEEPSAQAPATGLDPELEARFAAAVEGAAADGVALTLTSGWRSAEDQAGLVESALARYGSAEEAHRWVLPPERSAHVAGLAIDVGPTDGALWLESHGADYGLCRVYANEVWHFEPVIEAGGTCPDLLPDSSSGWDGIDS